MDKNRREEEIIREFSRVFLDIGRFTCIGRDHLNGIKTHVQRYEELKRKYGKGINTKNYDDVINFTLDELEINGIPRIK